MTVPMLSMWPSRKSFNPNQKARAKAEYMENHMGDSWMPISRDKPSPCLWTSLTEETYFFVKAGSAPRETTARIEPKISPAFEAALSFPFSTCCSFLRTMGVVMEYTSRTKSSDEPVTSVMAHE